MDNLFAMMMAQGASSQTKGMITKSLFAGMFTKGLGYWAEAQEQKAAASANIGMLDMSLKTSEFEGIMSKEQYDRFRKKFSGTIATRTAKMGIEFTGSPMEVMNDAITQINIDEAITNLNRTLRENEYLYQRDIQESAIKMAKYSMIANIVSTVASTVSMVAMANAKAPSAKTNQLQSSKLSGSFDTVPSPWSSTQVGSAAYTQGYRVKWGNFGNTTLPTYRLK